MQTSTTNIGAYMWSAVAAERLGIISHRELVRRMKRTITTLEGMERYEPSGQFYNWYDHHTGAKLTTWPPDGKPLTPILSSVDNGWLAVGLRIVADRVPEVSSRARAIYDSMDFGFYYRPDVNRILFHYVPSTGEAPCCYDTYVSESRIATYIGISKGEIPAKAVYGTNRAFETGCLESQPVGDVHTYFGTRVYDGALRYNGTLVTPSWGGSMFEALMPSLFVPEERWAPGSWGVNHPLTVDAQIHHGLTEAGYGYWGFSPANIPEGGYDAYGVDGIGSNPDGYFSNEDRTARRPGLPGLPRPEAGPAAERVHERRRHAARRGARPALPARPRRSPTCASSSVTSRSTRGSGFLDSVNVDSGVASKAYLSLDQGIIMASLGNALGHDVLRRAFATRDFEHALRPVIGVEEFASSPRPCTITGTPGSGPAARDQRRRRHLRPRRQ